MRVEWPWDAVASARRFLADQDGLRAVIAAAGALAEDPEPPGAVARGPYRLLRVGAYRVLYEAGDRQVVIGYVYQVT